MAKTRTLNTIPKKYSPVMGQRLVYALAEGKSIAQWCRDEGISKWTYKDWRKAYPEFKRAVELAKTFKEAKHHDELKEAVHIKVENQIAYKKYLEEVCDIKDEATTSVTLTSETKPKNFVKDWQKLKEELEDC